MSSAGSSRIPGGAAPSPGFRGNTVAFWIFATAVALAPLPFGLTDPADVAIWCVALGVALVLADPGALGRERMSLLVPVTIMCVAFGFVLHEQLSPAPWTGAAPNQAWSAAARLLGTPVEPVVSATRNQPWLALGGPLAAMTSLLCGFIVCADRARAHRLMGIVAWSGTGYAVFGICAFLIDPNMVLWREKLGHQGFLTATFLNRNTAAIYFGVCAVIWLTRIAAQIQNDAGRGRNVWQRRLKQILHEPSRALLVQSAMLLVCLVAMFMTGSRAGSVLTLGALVLACLCCVHRDLRDRRTRMMACGLALLAAGAAFFLLGAGISGRFEADGLATGGRLDVYRATLDIIFDHPWLGTGLGTFAWSFPPYRESGTSIVGIWDRAHNTWLELASDLGLPLAGLVCAGCGIILFVLIRGVRVRHRDVGLPSAGLAVAVLAGCHSVIDFPLQIPGFAIVACSCIGAGLAQSFRTGRTADEHTALPLRHPGTENCAQSENHRP